MVGPLHRGRHLLGAPRAGPARRAGDLVDHPRRQDAAFAARAAGTPPARLRAPATGAHRAPGGQRHAAGRGGVRSRRRFDPAGGRIPRRTATPLGSDGRAPPAPRTRRLADRPQARRPRQLGGRARRHRHPVLSKIFLDYDQAALDAQYDQRAWAPDMDQVIARYATASDAVRTRIGEPTTHAYGASAVEKLDVYGAGQKHVFVFVHGGAWRRESRRSTAYFAETILRGGAACVVLG